MPGTHRDLCWTCNFAATCVNRGTADRPKFYCEQFDAHVPAPPVSKKVASKTALDETKDSHKYQGLCLNCEDRETCTLSGSHGGVWHCEEYR